MPQVIYTEATDEIVDLVERVRTASDPNVALVLNPGTSGFQTPLNVRLLRQLGSRSGRTVSVISGDPHIQELSRVGGLPTYASVPAFERGIQTIRPHGDDLLPGAAGAAGLGAGAAYAAGPPPPPPPPPRAAAAPGAAAAVRGPQAAGRRRGLYFVAAGAAILGLVLVLVVGSSAKVTITLAGTPLTANPTIQGSPGAATAGQRDHIVTSVVSSTQASQFTATPSGRQNLPATPATATIVFSTDLPSGAQFTVPRNTEFDTQDDPPIRFLATQSALICVGPNGAAPANCPPGSSTSVPVQDGTAEAKGNVAANTITKWPSDPCPSHTPPGCAASDLTETNPQAASGGADAKSQVVASSSDVSGWSAQVSQSEQTLTSQAMQDLQTKAAGKTIAKDPGGNGESITCAPSPAIPAANTVFAATQVTITCNGNATVYNAGDITGVVTADLQSEVAQGDSLATQSITCTKPSVTQADAMGTVVLSIQCSSFSKPFVDLNALKGQLTGHSPADAKNIIEHRLDHVVGVTVSQSPVPFFWLPFFSSRIEIDEAFVTQPGR